MKIFGLQIGKPSLALTPAVIDVNTLASQGQQFQSPFQDSIYDGGKFDGGFGETQLFDVDYWTLRKRSSQLFTENPYANGILKRLITNEINTGLTPEASPDDNILGLDADELNDWTEMVETRFDIWAQDKNLCDWKQESDFGEIQRIARMEALIGGDVLVVIRRSESTKLPMIQLIRGEHVQTPVGGEQNIRKGHKVIDGVEFDRSGRAVAHWIMQEFGTSKRIPALGAKSGRRLSWLVYGLDKRVDEVRGTPLLSLVLQSLKEIDRYRDSVQRKATINSIIAMFIKKTVDKPGSKPISGSATRNDSIQVSDSDGTQRAFKVSKMLPGTVIEDLQVGEEPVPMNSQGTDLNFGEFESTIIHTIAWYCEMPPEIAQLAFSNNYSASQAAINEFKIYLNKIWSSFGKGMCSPIYMDWLISETLSQKIKAPGLLEAWRNPLEYDKFGAWMTVEWFGSIKPSTDMLKQAKSSQLLVELGLSTRAREARITTGMKFSKNMKKQKRENELWTEANRPLREFEEEFGGRPEEEVEPKKEGSPDNG